jgi:hypothetical protein
MLREDARYDCAVRQTMAADCARALVLILWMHRREAAQSIELTLQFFLAVCLPFNKCFQLLNLPFQRHDFLVADGMAIAIGVPISTRGRSRDHGVSVERVNDGFETTNFVIALLQIPEKITFGGVLV